MLHSHSRNRCSSGRHLILTAALALLAAGAWAQLPPTIDLNVTPGTESAEVTRVYGDDASDFLGGEQGNAVAFGDINGDGFDDLILGVYGADPPGGGEAGEVVVVYGSASLRASAEVDLNTAPGTHGETRIQGDDATDLAGWSVASGDINGDGFDDVILGAQLADPPGGADAGEVVVVYGSASLPSTVINLNALAGANGETRILADFAGGRLGWSVASGDVNGDGFDDVIVGASFAAPAGRFGAGEVVIVYGSASLPSAVIDLNSAPGTNGETRILGDDGDDNAGWSVASGDVNGDGFFDVILGAYDADPPGGVGGGEAVVVYGSASLSGTSQIDLSSAAGTNGETRILGDDGDDAAGWSVASGDVNADGFDDVILGARFADPPGGAEAGEVVVVYGSALLPASSEIDLNTGPGTHGETRILGDDSGMFGDEAGFSVASGDVNGDGFDDVILGAHAADSPGGVVAGEVVVVHGSAALPGSAVIDLDSVNGDVRVLGDNGLDRLGASAAAGGDVDRDGIAEFATSAFSGDNPSIGGANTSGVGYLIYGDGTTPSAAVSQFTRAGDGASGDIVPPTDFGAVVRCVIDFSDDDSADNGAGGASLTTVTLTRSDAGVNLTPLGQVADVHWEITTDRTGWTSADVTFQYTDAEIAGLTEGSLVIRQAPTLGGMYSTLPTTIDTTRNEATATVTGFSFFALAEAGTVPVELSVFSSD